MELNGHALLDNVSSMYTKPTYVRHSPTLIGQHTEEAKVRRRLSKRLRESRSEINILLEIHKSKSLY